MEQLGQADMDHAQRQVSEDLRFSTIKITDLNMKLCDGMREMNFYLKIEEKNIKKKLFETTSRLFTYANEFRRIALLEIMHDQCGNCSFFLYISWSRSTN